MEDEDDLLEEINDESEEEISISSESSDSSSSDLYKTCLKLRKFSIPLDETLRSREKAGVSYFDEFEISRSNSSDKIVLRKLPEPSKSNPSNFRSRKLSSESLLNDFIAKNDYGIKKRCKLDPVLQVPCLSPSQIDKVIKIKKEVGVWESLIDVSKAKEAFDSLFKKKSTNPFVVKAKRTKMDGKCEYLIVNINESIFNLKEGWYTHDDIKAIQHESNALSTKLNDIVEVMEIEDYD